MVYLLALVGAIAVAYLLWRAFGATLLWTRTAPELPEGDAWQLICCSGTTV